MRLMTLGAAAGMVVCAGCIEESDRFMAIDPPSPGTTGAQPGDTTTTGAPPTSAPLDDTTDASYTSGFVDTVGSSTTMIPGTDGGMQAVCGNGFIESDEECDDGDLESDDGCLSDCTLAVCGDGFVYENKEQCDDGNQSDDDDCVDGCKKFDCGDGYVNAGKEACDDGNQSNTDSCTNDCAAAACGDEFVQPGEACDDGNDFNGDGCEVDCTQTRLWVFVTEKKFSGEIGGLAGADQQCVNAATMAGLEGSKQYKAWLSDDLQEAGTRIKPKTGRFRRTDGLDVADSWEAFKSGALQQAILLNEYGNLPTGSDGLCGSTQMARTNTNYDGSRYTMAHDCDGFTKPVGPSAFGRFTATSKDWSVVCATEQSPTANCSKLAPIYCIQEPG